MTNKIDQYKGKATKEEEHFTTTELTQLTGLHRFTIHSYVEKGILKAKKNRKKHSNYKFSKNYIENKYPGIAKRHNTELVESAYFKLAFCNLCDVKLNWNTQAKEFVYGGTDQYDYRYCESCTKKSKQNKNTEE